MKSVSAGLLLWLLTVAGRAQAAADLQVVFGTGSPQPWTSNITVSSTSSVPTHVILSPTPDQTCPSETACTVADLAPSATVTLTPPPLDGVGLTYVGTTSAVGGPDDVRRPAVAARAFDDTGRSVDLPVLRLANLFPQPSPSRVVLTGVIGGAAGRSNLLLANVGPADQDAGLVILEVFIDNAAGVSLAYRKFFLSFGETLFIPNVVAWEGLPSLDQGQISVTSVGGGGPFWGVLSIVRADGSLSVVNGSKP